MSRASGLGFEFRVLDSVLSSDFLWIYLMALTRQ